MSARMDTRQATTPFADEDATGAVVIGETAR